MKPSLIYIIPLYLILYIHFDVHVLTCLSDLLHGICKKHNISFDFNVSTNKKCKNLLVSLYMTCLNINIKIKPNKLHQMSIVANLRFVSVNLVSDKIG